MEGRDCNCRACRVRPDSDRTARTAQYRLQTANNRADSAVRPLAGGVFASGFGSVTGGGVRATACLESSRIIRPTGPTCTNAGTDAVAAPYVRRAGQSVWL